MADFHHSVLLREVLQVYEEKKIGIFVDGTLGAGGHSAAILEAHPEISLLIGIDQDPQARAIAAARLERWKAKVAIVPGNFRDLKKVLQSKNIGCVDGILLDLGVSSMQLDLPEKGFSFSKEGPLDMRMDPSNPLTAEEIVNTWQEGDIARVIRDYGEEKRWRLAAKAIVEARKTRPIRTTLELAAVLNRVLKQEKKGIHPATLVFQALRICVNGELEALEEVLPAAIDFLCPGGRASVISFHSLEDRIVKNRFRYEASDKEDTSGIGGVFLDKKPRVVLLGRRPTVSSEEEISRNPRSRSAKLRAVEKI